MDQRSGVGYSVDELRFSSSTRDISMPHFEVLNALHNSLFKRKISLEEQKNAEKGPFPSRWTNCHLIYDQFRVTGSHDFVENYTDLFTIAFRNDDFQEFDSKSGRNFIVYDENRA